MNNSVECRFCGGSLAEFVDLGMSPLCESFLAKDQLNSLEPFYPLAAHVEELWTHGGSLGVYASHADDETHPTEAPVSKPARRKRAAGLHRLQTYAAFADRVRATRRALLSFSIEAMSIGRSVVGYGAAGEGNTLLNYCGIRTDFLDYTVERNPHHHGKFLPSAHIPIFAPEQVAETRPDYVLILPWNLKGEIMGQLAYCHSWGAKFVVPAPEISVI